jgi:hypothetical protein
MRIMQRVFTTHLVLARLFSIRMALVDKEVVRQDIVRYTRQVELEQASSLVRAVANKSFIAAFNQSKVRSTDTVRST